MDVVVNNVASRSKSCKRDFRLMLDLHKDFVAKTSDLFNLDSAGFIYATFVVLC